MDTFTYNRATGKTNLARYLIRSGQPFSSAEGDAFTDYICSGLDLPAKILPQDVRTRWN